MSDEGSDVYKKAEMVLAQTTINNNKFYYYVASNSKSNNDVKGNFFVKFKLPPRPHLNQMRCMQ